jgi:tetratricopeptide (TPR) repeat protein
MSEQVKNDDVKDNATTNSNVETKPETIQTEAPKKKNNIILRTALLAVLVIAAAFAIKHHMLTKDFNNALALKEAGKNEEAIAKFQSLSENAYGNIKKAANQELLKCYIESGKKDKAIEKLEKMAQDPSVSKTDLAQCYITLGDSPSNNAAQTKEYYKKAMEIAPEILTPIQHKVIDPTYVLPKPPPPTPEELAEAKKMAAEMMAEEAKAKQAVKTVKKGAADALKAIPTTK